MIPVSIGYKSDLGSFAPKQVNDIHELAEVVKRENYTLMTFKENRRLVANFISCTTIGLDYDKGNPSLEDAKQIFAGYKHIIGTTKSHQIEKSGEIVDRFRVIVFLSEPITDVKTYHATWMALAARFPGLDGQAKDAARFFAPCKEIVSVNQAGLLIKPVSPTPEVPKVKRPQLAVNEERGEPSKATLKLISLGVAAGSRNAAVHKAARDLHEQRYEFDEALEMLLRSPIFDDSDFTVEEGTKAVESAYKKDTRYDARLDQNQQLRELVDASLFVYDKKKDSGFLFDPSKGSVVDMSESALLKLLGRAALAEYRRSNFLFSEFKYDPFKPQALGKSDQLIPVYNCFRPPEWQRPNFYFGKALPVNSSLPEVYDSFFRHLVANDDASFDYLLDWLSTAVTARNFTILTAVGAEGIGKGILGEIMEKLFGEHNFVKTRDEIFKAKFNGQIENKRLVYLDEVAIQNEEQSNRLKDLVNSRIEIERKGLDAEYVENFASFYLSSNLLDAIKPGPNDRRFSVIQLSELKLLETPLIKRISELTAAANIEQLAGFLLNRQVTRDMLKPFRSERFERILEASLAEWEHYVIQDWAPRNVGAEITIADLQEHLKRTLDMRASPGRIKLEALARKFPKFLEFKKRQNGSVRSISVIGAPSTKEEMEQESSPVAQIGLKQRGVENGSVSKPTLPGRVS